MDFRVRFRFNKVTGEVETFSIEDEQVGVPLDEAEHNRRHDQVAAEVGRQIERNPIVREILDNTIVASLPTEVTETLDSNADEQTHRQK